MRGRNEKRRFQISRRTFLRGLGVTMALPWLESVPVWGAEPAGVPSAPPKRFAALFMGNGINGDHWSAKGAGAVMEWSSCEQPITGYHETNFSMAYSSHISWQSADSPVPMEVYPFLGVRNAHHSASHNDLSDDYERISRYYVGNLAHLAAKLDAMPEGEGTVLDNTCLLYLSNMWSGARHDNTKLPVLTVGGLGGTLETGRVLDYSDAGDGNRKLCSLHLSLMDRLGVKLPRFGDADARLAGL